MYDYDLFVIGAGSGGVRTARVSASLGAKVAICEDRYMGGTCVNVGCVPKKLFAHGARFSDAFEDARGFGWTLGAAPHHDWSAMVAGKDKEIKRLNGIYHRLLDLSGAKLIEGRGKVLDPHTVEVNGERYSARHILIATGGWPWTPPITGAEFGITSNEAFSLPERPERVVVVGGGYIGVEFASIFRGLGSMVHLVHRRHHLLRDDFDDGVRHHLGEALHERGIHLHLDTRLTEVHKHGDGMLSAGLSDGSQIDANVVMFATGRRPNTRGLGLNSLGVKQNTLGAILVDDHYRSSVPSILALGDVIDKINLTPVATAQGMLIARQLFGGDPEATRSFVNVPTAVFSQPPVGTVGLNEREARKEYPNIDIYQSVFRPLAHTITGREEKTFMKLIVDHDTDRVLGCHMVGPAAGETIQGFAVALQCGATKTQLDSTIGIHPTAAEEFVTMRTPVPELGAEE